MTRLSSPSSFFATRRDLLRAGTAVAAAGSAGLLATHAWSQQPRKKITFAWSQISFCLTPVPVALERGIFEKNGLDV
ncbi:MAG TPA: twin-arginine translocation signal domain-containing protein, partial [Burkholderiaceae bacterium]